MSYEEFQAEVEPFLGQLVLSHYDVVLLQGTSRDQWDYYHVFIQFKNRVVHSTAVGMFYPLKRVLPDKQYNELVRVWNLNNDEQYQAI